MTGTKFGCGVAGKPIRTIESAFLGAFSLDHASRIARKQRNLFDQSPDPCLTR
jgi:hypothetical protein